MSDTSSNQRDGRLSRAVRYVRTEPGLLRNVVAIAVVVVLGLGIGGTILSQQRFTPPWTQQSYVWATFSEAASVAPGLGQNVQINGVQVGEIQDAQIDNLGRAQLLLTIREADYDRPVYRNATVVMRPTTPLNTMYVELNPGTPDAPELPDYGVLPLESSVSPVQIDRSLSQLDDEAREMARELLSQADVALANAPRALPGGLEAGAGVTRSLAPIAQQLDTRRDNVRQLVTALGQVSATLGNDDVRLTNLANSLQTTLAATAAQNDAIRDSFNQLPGVTDALRDSTGAVQGLSDQLDPTLDNVREASETLPDSLSGLTETVDTLDTTVDRLDPVAEKLRPTAADLRPFVDDLNRTFPDLKTITSQLNPVTERLVPYLPDLTAFVYQLRSVINKGDRTFGEEFSRNSIRAIVQGGACSIPNGPPLDSDGKRIPGADLGVPNPLCNLPSKAPVPPSNVPDFKTFEAKDRKDDRPERKDERTERKDDN